MTLAALALVAALAPGYAGDDEFRYEAFARGQGDTPVRLLVTVKVRVQPPR